MTQDVERQPSRTPAQELVATVRSDAFQGQIELALPEGMPARRFVRVAATALLENPELAGAEHDSVFASLLKAAADGLLPDGREAALVLFKQKGSSKPRAAYLPMIGGYRKIAGEHGWRLETQVVREGDEFSYELGLASSLRHLRRAPDGAPLVAAYAIARKRGEEPMFEVMTAAEVAKVRATSRAKDAGPWVEWEDRMWEKTVGRRLFAKLPLGERDDARIARLVEYDSLPPSRVEELVYGPPELPAHLPAGGSGSREAPPEAEAVAAATAAPFEGAEPPEPPPTPEPEHVYVLPDAFTRYAGEPLEAIVAAGDREYLEWLASDAIADEELRAAAAAVLERWQE